MDDKSMANQGAVPNQAALEAQQTFSAERNSEGTAGQTHFAGGSALLDAEAQAGTQMNDLIEDQAATDLSDDQAVDDPTEAKRFTTTGDYPVDLTQLDDEGNLSLTNDVPGAE